MGFYVVGSAVCFGFKLSEPLSEPCLKMSQGRSWRSWRIAATSTCRRGDRCFREWKVWSQSCLGQLRQVTFMVLARRSIGMRMALQMQA